MPAGAEINSVSVKTEMNSEKDDCDNMENTVHINSIKPENDLAVQADTLSGRRFIKSLKNRVAYSFLICCLLVVIIETSVLLSLDVVKNYNTNVTVEKDYDKTWFTNLSTGNQTFKNCVNYYDIGSNIRVSDCINDQYGRIVDIRIFLNDKATVKGIAIPHEILPRLVQAVLIFY